MSLTKVELAAILYETMHIDKKRADELVEMFFEEMKNGILKDGSIQISGFGKLQVKKKRERLGRNPKTGGAMTIDARKVVTYQHSQVLKGRLNSGKK